MLIGQHNAPREGTTTPLLAYIDLVAHEGSSDDGAAKARAQRILANLDTYVHSKQTHEELLERYNPTHSMSASERVAATARRVGLDVPETA